MGGTRSRAGGPTPLEGGRRPPPRVSGVGAPSWRALATTVLESGRVKALLQRVRGASVTVGDEVVGQIGPGLVVFLGISRDDTAKDIQLLADKTLNLRIFADGEGRFNLSILESGGELLVVSQFTLLADTRKGRRPSFIEAAPPAEAEALYEQFLAGLRASGLRVEAGRFQAYMLVEIHNDGPVTILLDSREKRP